VSEPLAIVGMACRLPGADGLDAFWNLVSEGRTAWGPLPASRFDRDLYFHPEKSRVGKSYSELGAVVSDRPVDPAACPITPEMLAKYDVAHHVFLEVASLACRDAGLDPFAMPADRRTGVYVGHTGGSTRIGDIVYSTGIDETATLLADVDLARELLGPDVAAVAAELTSAVRDRYPGRVPGEKLDLGALAAAKIVQEALRLDGPYLVVDAACASSLQAMAIGARALLQGGIDQAIVGGASYCKSDSLVLFSAAQSVSNRGSCPFGEAADGLVTAEGYVALVIKTLARAVADGDRIRAVIHGLGVASDGKGKSLWAPRQEGQVLAVERAYPRIDDIGRIEYIEAHATSTQVGDATELGALSRLLARHLPAGRQIPIGSVKANVGHTLETAGMASLVKVVLAMEHGMIPPGSTCTDLNSEFDWAGGPFTVPRAPVAWPRHADGSPRFAAVNAFGIGGLNVHVALGEHVDRPAATRPAVVTRAEPDAIAIVGAGCVLPGAFTLEAFFELLDRGETAIGPVPPERWNAARVLDRSGPHAWHTVADQGGFVRGFAYDWRRHKVPPKQIAAANPLQFMLLEAADAAIADAGGPAAGLDRVRTGVVVGTMFGGEFANQLQMGLRLPETGRSLRASLERRGIAAADADRIVAAYEKKLLEKLPALIDETGSFTSSTLASRLTKTFDLMGGALALDSGNCSSVSALAVATDMLREGACDAVICAAGQRSMDLMSFEGLSLGGRLAAGPTSVLDGRTNGTLPAEAAVVFVLKRLADARAAGNAIRGVIRGVALGSGRSTTAALRRVIREADEAAGLAPEAVRALEVAVAGGHDKTREELGILAANYARRADGGLVAGAVDGLIGHAGAAAGAASLVAATRAVVTGTLPGTAGVGTGPGVAGIAASSRPLPIEAVDAAGYRAAAITVAHDEQVGHVVIDNGLPVPEAARPHAGREPARTSPAVATAAPARGRPLVAAIFPGQGSQYTDMFRGLATETAEGGRALARLDALARAAGHETLAEIAWRADNGLGTRIWDTQWAMYLGDLFAWHVLRDMGFAADVVASHSFGEFPALAAAGGWTAEDGARAARARADAVERHGPRDGGMLSVIADRATVASILEPFAGQAWVCAENAPEQSVVGGSARAVDAVQLVSEGRRVKCKRLAVPSPFHTPLLAEAGRHLAAALGGIAITAPAITTFGSSAAERLPDAAAVRESLVRQMTETVRWVSVVEALYAAGVRTFVEVGPGGALTGLARRILEGRDGVQFVQFDQRGRPAAEHLVKLREQLVAAGALAPAPAVAPAAPRAAGRIVSFDATARRRQRNRAGAAAPRTASNAAPAAAPVPPQSERPRPVAATAPAAPTMQRAAGVATAAAPSRPQPVAHRDPEAAARHLEDVVESLLAEARVAVPLARAGAAHPGVASFLDAAGHLFDLTRVDRAAVLEAASLDALCDVLARAGGKAAWLARRPDRVAASAPQAAARDPGIETFLVDFVVEQTGYPREIVELDADLEADLGIDSIRKAQLFGEIGQKYGLTADENVSLDDFRTLRHLVEYMLPRVGGGASAVSIPEPAAPSAWESRTAAHTNGHASAPVVASSSSASSSAELETFLVDFVVEQTGYPREIVELDADLEADLGIDSIRKAQLFGEIGQKYGLTADENVSLDDFRTLRHLVEYMLPRVGGGASAVSIPEPAAPSAWESRTAAHTNGHASAPVVASSSSASSSAELETFLVDFVVEQTGYPREIVELDADLEADLGIDSIRKAQLFGEIGQKYGLTADENVSLDDFRTLRHLVEYMLPRVGDAAVSTAAPSESRTPAPSAIPPVVAAAAPRRSAAFERGIDAGRRHADAIRRWARLVTLAAVDAAAMRLPEAIDDELAGLAEGAGVDAAVVRAAYGDPAAALGGCDAVVVAPGTTGAAAVGLVIGVGRDADPVARPFDSNGLRGVIVSARALPGGVAGWNDAGLVAVAGRGPATGGVVARIVESCRTIDDVRGVLAGCERPPVGLVVAAAAFGVASVDATGGLTPPVPTLVRADARSPLARVLLADGGSDAPTALAMLLDHDPARVRAAVSATAAWLAVGSCGGAAVVHSGGPQANDWVTAGAAGLGPAWVPAAEAVAPSSCETDVTRRYVLGMRDAGEPQRVRGLTGDRVLIVGGGPLATALGRALAQVGATPLVAECGSVEEAIAAVERAEEGGAIRHLVLATARRRTGDWLPGRGAAVLAPFFACQRWLVLRGRAGDIRSATLTATVDLGGDFGIGGSIDDVTGGALAGLLKGIARETAGLHVRVIDAPTALADAPLAAAVVAEIRDGDGPVEIGLVAGRRITPVPREERPARGRALAATAPGSVWIVTGGARGVTAACARELGRRHGLSLVLLGSTHPVAVEEAWLALDDAGLRDLKGRVMLDAKSRGDDPRAAWRAVEKSIEIAGSLARFRAAGVTVRYEPCNLADAAAVRSVVARVTREVGPIRGIVHGAGYEAACRFEKKSLEGLEATLAPKCAGLEHLLAAVDPAALEAVVAFGSTSGRLGGHGQADYSLANDMLAKIVGRARRARGLRATTFHWHAWDEVGMASRPESRFVLEQFGLRFMPLAEGVRRFMDEIEAGLPDAEVLVTEPAMCPDAVPSPADARATESDPAPHAPAPTRGSLVETVEERGGRASVVIGLDPATDRFLLDHLQYGRPLLPAVMGAEILAQAAIAAGACDRVTEIRDFAVERPIGFPTDQRREVRVEIAPTPAGIEARGLAAVITADGRVAGEDRVHVTATVSGGPIDPIVTTLDEPPFPLNPMVYQETAPLKHGPAFRTLTGLFLDRTGGWGRLVSLPGDPVTLPRGGRGWTVPVALLDGCIVGCAVYSYILCGRRVEVPVRFDRLRIEGAARSGESCTVRMLYRSHDARESIYDLVLFGDDGRAILALDGLHLAVMSGERSPPA
jgi:acyl transferase domain-containing protein